MRLRIEETVEGIEPEAALAWWTDFQDGPHDHAFVPGARRRVRSTEGGFVIRDEVGWLGIPVFREEVEARPRGNKVELVGENTWARFRARYVFEHDFDPEGTLVRLTAEIDGKGPLSWVQRLVQPIVRAVLRWDTRKHLEQMRDELAASSDPG